MPSQPGRNWAGGPLAVIGALVLAGTMWFYVVGVLIPYQVSASRSTGDPRGNLSDLYPRWWGAHEVLLHGRDPYSAAVTREIQIVHYGRPLDPTRPGEPKDQQGFAYPVYVAFLLAPTLGLPFPLVQTAFAWLLLALTALSVPLWMAAMGWRPGPVPILVAILLTLGSYTTAQGFALQQLSLLVGALLAAAAALLVTGHPVAAGLLLAVATIKPQITAPIVAWLGLWTVGDWRRRQPLAWSFLAAMGVLLVGAELVSPGWIGRFRTALADYQQYTGGISLLSAILTPVGGLVATLALLAGVAVVCWRQRRAPAGAPGFALATALVLAVTLLIIPTWAPYNYVLLLPGLLLLARERNRIWARGRAARYAYLIVWTLAGWPLAATLGLALASAVLPAPVVQRGWALPLWTSLFIPFGVLVALAVLLRATWAAPAPRAA